MILFMFQQVWLRVKKLITWGSIWCSKSSKFIYICYICWCGIIFIFWCKSSKRWCCSSKIGKQTAAKLIEAGIQAGVEIAANKLSDEISKTFIRDFVSQFSDKMAKSSGNEEQNV